MEQSNTHEVTKWIVQALQKKGHGAQQANTHVKWINQSLKIYKG